MTLEPALIALCCLAGSALLVGLGRPSLRDQAALAFPTGVAAVTAVSFVLVVTPVPYSAAAALGLTLAAGAPLAVRGVASAAPRRRVAQVAPAVIWALTAAVICLVARRARMTRVTADSYEYLQAAGLFEAAGRPFEDAYLLVARQFLAPVAHNLAGLGGEPFLVSLAPLFAVSGLVLLWWVAAEAAGPRRPDPAEVRLVVAVVAVLVTANRFVFHAFYVNAHLMVGVYALVVVAVPWLVARGRLPGRMVVVAGLAVVAIVVARPESPLLLGLLLVPPLFHLRLDRRWASALVGTFAGAVVVWWGLGLRVAADWTPTSAAVTSVVAALGTGGLFMATGRPEVADAVRRWSVPALHAGLWAALVGFVALRGTDLLATSLAATWDNLAGGEGLWGVLPWLLPVAVVAVAVTTRLPDVHTWLLPLLAYVPFGLVLAYAREAPYRVGPGDSLNRMWVHVLFVAAGYVVAALLHRPVARRASDASDEAGGQPARSASTGSSRAARTAG